MDIATVIASCIDVPQAMARKYAIMDMPNPSINPTRISCQKERIASERSISPTASARMMVLVVCEPAFPPVPINRGYKKRQSHHRSNFIFENIATRYLSDFRLKIATTTIQFAFSQLSMCRYSGRPDPKAQHHQNAG